MLPREFLRRVEAFRERQEAKAELEKNRFFNMLNAVGTGFHGREWKWQSPHDVPDDFEEREKRALERHFRRRQQKAQA